MNKAYLLTYVEKYDGIRILGVYASVEDAKVAGANHHNLFNNLSPNEALTIGEWEIGGEDTGAYWYWDCWTKEWK